MGKRRKPQKKRPPGKHPGVASKFSINFGSPDALQATGPLIHAAWLAPKAQAELLASAGKPVPRPAVGMVLIDTGAQRTCISLAAAQALGLRPISKVKGFGAGGVHTNDLVFARLEISIQDHRNITTILFWEGPYQAIPEMENHLPGLQVQGRPTRVVGLLGRDILRHASIIYNGKNGTLQVNFDPDWIRARDVTAQLAKAGGPSESDPIEPGQPS